MGNVLSTLLPAILSVLPNLITSVESLFKKKPKSGPDKLQAILNLVGAGGVIATLVDPTDKAAIEDYKSLVTSITNDVVAFFNKHGWPTKLGGG